MPGTVTEPREAPALGVKICGLTRPGDAGAAAEAGADYLGVILSVGFGRSVEAQVARTFRPPGGPVLVGVVVDETPAGAAALAERAGADVLQLHGDEAPEVLAALRERGPWRLWKAVRPRSSGDLLAALERYGGVADALLVDGWHPDLRGGAGARFPWSVLEEVRGRFPAHLEVVAAGGLNPDNVADAVRRLAPHVVDVSSGVEVAPGRKDPQKVRAFVAAARRAAAHRKSTEVDGGEGRG